MMGSETEAPRLSSTASDVPEDVRTELDADERRLRGEPVLAVKDTLVPEDVLCERDREARLGSEEVRQRLAEGEPPAEEEPLS